GRSGAAFFGLLGSYLPPPPAGAQPPLLWGEEQHVREVFGECLQPLSMTRGVYVETATDPHEYWDFYTRTFGPVVAVRNSLRNEPAALANFDLAFLEFAVSANQGPAEGPAEYPYEYLLVCGQKAAPDSRTQPHR